MNCWQFRKCGREPGGVKVDKLGICPAAVETRVDGINGGENAGRCCWAVAGAGNVNGNANLCSFSLKLMNCIHCEFFELVVRSEGRNYVGVKEIIKKLQNKSKK